MAIVKVLGTETEYGIIVRGGGEPNPIAASSALINAYVSALAHRIAWDFQDESPGARTRAATYGRARWHPMWRHTWSTRC